MAELAPRPDAPALVRKLPAPSPAQHRPDDARPLEVHREAAPARDRRNPVERRVADAPQGAAGDGRAARSGSLPDPVHRQHRAPGTSSKSYGRSCARLVPDGDLAAVIEAAVSEKIERLKA